MTTLLLLPASLALVALIGAALVYAVNRLVTWSVDLVEGRRTVASTPAPVVEQPEPTSSTTPPAPSPISAPAATERITPPSVPTSTSTAA